jgi:eukaryotic-like serine/threonine-protein kinase
MSEHLSIGELERLRAGEESTTADNGRSLDEIRTHLDSCAACQGTYAELGSLDALVSRVREVSGIDNALVQGQLSIDGYTISHEIHRGGQGIVYHAMQNSTGRKVAIKVLLKGALATDGQRMRFEREIDLASRINHPNVVSIIDRGATADGRGYLAMELIEGPTLDGYLAERELSVEDRLRIFLQICDGVVAAHQRGVLHRDLKPANILIDQAGRPRLLDFGLAKDHLNESATLIRTMEGEFMGTLAYASPEQLRGDPSLVDARTDIYTLGVLLYEMLCGKLPHEMSGSIEAVIQRVLEQTPTAPSVINGKLEHDLDVVVLHAMEHEPQRRYQTVEGFANDVRAVREHRPIEARRASTVYQLRKFARRHRAGVAVVGVLVLGMIGTMTGLTIGIVRTNAANRLAEQRRIAAETELDKQSRISVFFRDLLSEVDPGQSGPDMRVMELLDVAAGEVDERFGEYPELGSSIQSTIGETYTRLGSYVAAERQLVGAIDAMESLDETPVMAMASTLVVLAQVQTATTRLDDADATLDRAQGLIEGVDVPNELLGQLEHQRGALLYERGEFAQSIEVYKRAMSRLGDLEEEWSKRIGSQVLIGMGVSLKRLERFEESLEAYEQALGLLSDVRGENHPDTLACLSNRAEVLNNLGLVDEAESQLWDLIERRKQVFGPTHERVGITLNNLADLLRERQAFGEASELFDEAIEIFRLNPGDPSLRLAITIHNAGVMHLEQSHFERAEELLAEAAAMTAETLPEGHWIQAQFHVKFAECLMNQGRVEDAKAMLVEARPDLAESMGEEHRRVVHVDSLLSQIESMGEN